LFQRRRSGLIAVPPEEDEGMFRVLRFAFLVVATLGSFPALVDQAIAGEREMARRGVDPESYIVSSSDLISPEAGDERFARDAWVSSASTVTVARTGGGTFWIRILGPGGVGVDWLQVENVFTWQATTQGLWRAQFGQVNSVFLVDFRALATDPLSSLLAAVREEVAAGGTTGPHPRPSAQVLRALLRHSERALDAGQDAIARHSLERFTRLVTDLVDDRAVYWATGQLWLNAAEYVIDHIAAQGRAARKGRDSGGALRPTATTSTTWGGIKGLYR
jgi:hypothetical protein